MNILMNLVLGLQIVTALAMIGLVLIQHGKGADMGASFGSGASGSLFGASGSANFLSRSTAVCAALFFVCTLYLAYSANDRPRASTGSVLDRPAASASAPVGAASNAFAIPGAASGAVALPAMTPASVPSGTGAASGSSPANASSGAAAIPQK